MSGWTSVPLHRRAGLLAGLLILGACGNDTRQALLDDYVSRIARVTGTTVALREPASRPGYPARRALNVEIPRRTIDVAEFFELHGCDMGELVGFRNSPLGRLQTPSQRLGYETAWLHAAQACGADAEQWLTEMGADKRRWLPALFWNATFAAEEMRTALGGAAPPADAGLADILRGLGDSLTRVEEGGFEIARFEQLLGRLRQGSWLGPARHQWSLWRRYLRAGSTSLRRAVPGICLNRRATPATRRLENVFMKFYVQQVQPDLAREMATHRDWLTELARLSDRLDSVAPEAYRDWYRAVLSPDDPDSEWRRTRQAVVDHVEAWQALFAHCNIEPLPGLGQD